MSDSTNSRVALVTGASAGIGKAIVRRLLADDWTVYGGARRLDQMTDIETEGARVLSLDVTDEASMQAAVNGLMEAEGRIDALVNNAGYGSYGAIEDVPIDEARRQFEVNVFGLFRLTQLVLPAMRAAGRGTIVNISSMGGRIWMPIGGWYHATKHAVEVLSDALRLETKPFGINVVVIQPGAIESEWAGISAANLRKTLDDSVYQDWGGRMVRVLEDYDKAAPPEVVANAVSTAVNSTSPKRRYATPLDAKSLIFLRWLLPDSLYEGLLKLALK